MKLSGEVLIDFNDKKNNLKTYRAKTQFKDADIFTADEERYEYLRIKGYVAEGKKVEEILKNI